AGVHGGGVARQPVHPPGAVQREAVPPLRAPAVADATLLEHEVIDPARGELTTDAEPGLARADYEAVDAVRGHRAKVRAPSLIREARNTSPQVRVTAHRVLSA